MSTFLYKGFTKDGAKIGGAKDFKSEEEMKLYLKDSNIEGLEIFSSKTQYTNKQFKYVSRKELSIFCKQMSVVFFSYVTLMEGIEMISDQCDNKELNIALGEIHDFMDKGYTFAETIAMYDHIFGKYLINMILIGESSGSLDSIFSDMSNYFEKESKVHKKIRAAVAYPLVLSVVMLGIIVFLVNSILPMFNSMLMSMGATPTVVTGAIMSVTKFLNFYGLIFIGIVVLALVGMKIYFNTEKGSFAFDKMKTTMPVFRYLTVRVIATRFARSLAVLLKSGVQLVSAVEQSIVVIDNKYLNDKFLTSYEKIKNGEKLDKVLDEIGIFPKLFIKMVTIGQTTGNIDVMLDKSASIFEEEVDESIEKVTKYIEPILILILSLIIGVILLAIMLPMIDIMKFI